MLCSLASGLRGHAPSVVFFQLNITMNERFIPAGLAVGIVFPSFAADAFRITPYVQHPATMTAAGGRRDLQLPDGREHQKRN